MPGGTPSTPKLAAFLPAFPALLRKQTKGAVYPAPRAILSAAVEGAQVDFDTASRIESRYLTNLIVNQGSKNMIQAFFFDLQAINSGSLRPDGIPPYKAVKVGVLGAGMMGAGIAYSCARAGMEVVLKDVAVESAEKGKAYSAKLLDKAIAAGQVHRGEEGGAAGPDHGDADPADLAGCDLVIEAVFEDPSLKARVFAEIAPYVNADALLCSNTSTLPITELAAGVDRPTDFIGLHFFSPVDKMPLVEIIRGEETSDEALAKAYDVVQQIRKTPIVVNDSRGFYTSRVIGTMVNEGLAMLGEGVHPVSLERAATQAGYPVGTLQLTDELNMELMLKIAKATQDAAERDGLAYTEHPGTEVIRHDDRARPPLAAQGRRLLRLRRVRQAPGAVVRAGRDVPGGRGAGPVRGRQGPDAVRRGARDREVLRGGRHHLGGRREHRLDHGHRLPAEDRWRRAVHDRLRGAGPRPAATARSGWPRSWPGPTSWPRGTATGSAPRRTCGRWRRTASPSPPDLSLPVPQNQPTCHLWSTRNPPPTRHFRSLVKSDGCDGWRASEVTVRAEQERLPGRRGWIAERRGGRVTSNEGLRRPLSLAPCLFPRLMPPRVHASAAQYWAGCAAGAHWAPAMDFSPSPRAADLTARVAAFIADEIEPVEPAYHRDLAEQRRTGDPWQPLPILQELKDKARAQGLWNLFLPRDHAGEYAARFGTDGGEGLSNVDYAPIAELTGRSAIAPLVLNCNAPDTGNMEVLLRYGSRAAAQEWLEPLLDGRIRSAFAMTEPGVASSDATNMEATAVVDGDEVVVNGRKWWTTGVGNPDCKVLVFMGLTDPDADRHHRHSMVLVPRDAPGVKVERMLNTMGVYDEPLGHGEVSLHRRAGSRRPTSSAGPARRSRSPRAGSARAGCTTACG